MALTLVEAAKYAANEGRVADSGYIEEFARSSDLLQAMPWKNINGNAYSYSKEDTLPTGIGYRGVNEAYTEGTGIINPQTETLRIYGGEIKVDKFIVDTLGPQERSIQEAMKVKAMALAIGRDLIKGSQAADSRAFDGLQTRITGSQLFTNAANGGALSLANLDAMLDEVDGATHLIMNKTMRRRLTAASRSTTLAGFITYGLDDFGRKISMYNDLPILIVDYDNFNNQIMPFNEVVGSGNLNTSIYAVKFAEGGVMGLQGPVEGTYGLKSKDIGELETQPAYLTRIEWYLSMAVFHGRSAARLQGITDAAVVA